jgi:L,D-peptidoglycan transpeptidase YkuD (ErfK/YbiS/YcfS/YnhG family)
MTLIRVDADARRLHIGTSSFPCVIGRSGAIPAADKREGDGATPLGRWPVRGVLLRADRVKLERMPLVPWRWLRGDDGWSDDPRDPAYNRPVSHPHGFGAERLWREDAAYDVIIVLGHNDAPPVPGLGSAIFFHQWVAGADGQPKPTEGCVAVAPGIMPQILGLLMPESQVEIVASADHGT